ncbi:MAG: peptidase T [Gaiella sp.]
MTDDRYGHPLAEALAPDLLERFLRYAAIDTQAALGSDTVPSTAKQLELSRLLVDELRELGVADAELVGAVVYGTIPGTVEGTPVVALFAHVDTALDAAGGPVVPLVHERWDGTPIVLPGDPRQVLDPAELPELAARVGHDLVTSDGTTLLGADDKAGVAAIMAAAKTLLGDDRPRTTVRVVFTTDEEIGYGADRVDLERVGAHFGYTLDGGNPGEMELETFSAYEASVEVRGVPSHTGDAKGRMVNALKLAAAIVAELPDDRWSPETTEGREGFVHPYVLEGGMEHARLLFLVRDHDDALLDAHVEALRVIVDRVAAREPRAEVTFGVREQYRNMRSIIDRHPAVVQAAVAAMGRLGLEVSHPIIRGGTDGSRLSAMGLPTPNIFTGMQAIHSVKEWLSVQDAALAAATVVELARVVGEGGVPRPGV